MRDTQNELYTNRFCNQKALPRYLTLYSLVARVEIGCNVDNVQGEGQVVCAFGQAFVHIVMRVVPKYMVTKQLVSNLPLTPKKVAF